MSELFFMPLFVVTVVIALPTVGYMLISLFEGFPRLKLAQVAGIVAVSAWIFTPFVLPVWDEAPFLFVSGVVLLLTFFTIWRREFRLLMLRRDDEFPGRWDKLGWFLMLTFAAPAGIWLYRSFRKARWPEAGRDAEKWGDAIPAKASHSPWDHDDEPELSPLRVGVD